MQRFIFLSIGIVILIGLFFVLKPTKQIQAPDNTVNTTVLTPTPPKVFSLMVKNRERVSGLDILKVNKGDEVTIKITVDEDEELHLHGYDKSVDLEKEVEGVLRFVADKTGRFPYELEHSGVEIGVLEVLPQ